MSTINPQVGAVPTDTADIATEVVAKSDLAVPQVMGRVVIPATPTINTTNSITNTQISSTTSTTGRSILPVVYFNLPRGRVTTGGSSAAVAVVNQSSTTGSVVLNHVAQVLPTAGRGSTFIPALAPKVAVNASTNSTISTTPVSQSGNPGNQQPTFVTIHAPMRATQSGNINTPVTSSAQPHFVTITKDSLTDSSVGMALKTIVTQASSQQPQFVTIQGPVAKTNYSGATGPGSFVTIRAPILASSAQIPGGASSGGQNQFVTIQGLQTGPNQPTFVPIPATGGTTMKTQPHAISYLSPVLKNGGVPSLVASSPKVMLSTIPTLQKTLASPVSQCANVVPATHTSVSVPAGTHPTGNIVAISRNLPNSVSRDSNTVPAGSPTISIASIPGANILTISRPGANPTVTVLPAKDGTDGKITVASPSMSVASLPAASAVALSKNAVNPLLSPSVSLANLPSSNTVTVSKATTPIITVPSQSTSSISLTNIASANTVTISKNLTNPTITVLPQASPPITLVNLPTTNSITVTKTSNPTITTFSQASSISLANAVTVPKSVNPTVAVLPFKETADRNTATPPTVPVTSTPAANILTFSRNTGNPNVIVLPVKESLDTSIFTQSTATGGSISSANIVAISRNTGSPTATIPGPEVKEIIINTPSAPVTNASIVTSVSRPAASPNVIVLPARTATDASIVTSLTATSVPLPATNIVAATETAATDPKVSTDKSTPSQLSSAVSVATVPTSCTVTSEKPPSDATVTVQRETADISIGIETATTVSDASTQAAGLATATNSATTSSIATSHVTATALLPKSESSDLDAETVQRPSQTRITVLPFSLSSEMTVTATDTTESSTGSTERVQQTVKEKTSLSTSVVKVAVEKKATNPSKLNGVKLPDSTTLTPVPIERHPSTPNILRRDYSVRKDSIVVHKEPLEIKIRSDTDTRRSSLLISNNASTTIKPVEKADGSSKQIDLDKCLQEAVDEIFSAGTPQSVSSDNSAPSKTIVTCGEDDEVTLIKVSASEESQPKFTAPLDDPDDIKIELIKLPVEDVTRTTDHKMESDEVSIKIEPTSKSRSPSPVCSKTSLESAQKTPRGTKFTPKSLSSLRSSSVLKRQIMHKANMLLTGSQKKKSSLLKPTQQVSETKETPISESATVAEIPNVTDPLSALEWKNGIGLLPGSDLKFRMNEFGLIEMVSDDDKDQEGNKWSSQQSSQNSDEVTGEGSGGSSDEKDEKPDKSQLPAFDDEQDKKEVGPDDIIRCQFCGCYGVAAEFYNNRFCSNTCADSSAVKKANEFKREQEHRALKLRRKRRRLERMCERQEIKKEEVDYLMEIDNLNEDKNSQPFVKNNSSNATPIASDDDMSVTSNDALETSKGKTGKQQKANVQFTWVKYLEAAKAKAAPAKLFKDDNLYTKNKFKIGWKLEGIDPEHPAHFCVLTVAEVRGYRLRLHFDGFSDSHDFWVNVDSPEIFPVGWCLKNNRRLSPPRGYTAQNFNWASYLKACRAFPAPRHLFTKNSSNVCVNGFRVGMKLEALDRKDTSSVCVATVADVLDNRILIHFDSWDDMYDYWADPSSPYIHPVGWCAENNVTLTPPNQFKEPSDFSWNAYLKQTKSIPAPARAFKQRPPLGFKRGMRLEAVDKRVPHLIRVATVEEATEHRILIHFDGWPHIYDFWVDEDSSDVHRPGWCRDTKHPLEPPPSKQDLADTSHCPTPGCKGEGHIKGPKYATHNSIQNCPYALENMDKDGVIPDRLYSKSELNDIREIPLPPEKPTAASLNNTLRLVDGRRPLGRPPKWRRLAEEEENRRKRRRISDDDDRQGEKRPMSPLESASKLQLELHQSVFEPGYKVDLGSNRSACWAKHSLPLHSSPMLTDDTDPHTWGPSQVTKFVSTVAGLEKKAQAFTDEEIDGEAFLMMTQQDLVENLGLKLGPAIKLYNCIVLLRQKGT